jgi:hypothetical protein
VLLKKIQLFDSDQLLDVGTANGFGTAGSEKRVRRSAKTAPGLWPAW